MSEGTLDPATLNFRMNTAVLNMNKKLRDQGYNERERAFMWGMTITEQREFLTAVWEHMHNDKTESDVLFDNLKEKLNGENEDNPKKEGASEHIGKPRAPREPRPPREIRSDSSDSQQSGNRSQ